MAALIAGDTQGGVDLRPYDPARLERLDPEALVS